MHSSRDTGNMIIRGSSSKCYVSAHLPNKNTIWTVSGVGKVWTWPIISRHGQFRNICSTCRKSVAELCLQLTILPFSFSAGFLFPLTPSFLVLLRKVLSRYCLLFFVGNFSLKGFLFMITSLSLILGLNLDLHGIPYIASFDSPILDMHSIWHLIESLNTTLTLFGTAVVWPPRSRTRPPLSSSDDHAVTINCYWFWHHIC